MNKVKTRVLRRKSVKGAYSPSSNHSFYGWDRFVYRDHVPNMSHMNFYNMIKNQKSIVRCGMSVAWQREV